MRSSRAQSSACGWCFEVPPSPGADSGKAQLKCGPSVVPCTVPGVSERQSTGGDLSAPGHARGLAWVPQSRRGSCGEGLAEAVRGWDALSGTGPAV